LTLPAFKVEADRYIGKWACNRFRTRRNRENRRSGRGERAADRRLPQWQAQGVQLARRQVMKATKGKANPAQVNELLKRKLGNKPAWNAR
jgi:hypothetical protein